MNTQRVTAVVVGILFILGTVAGVLAGAFTAPIRAGLSFPLNIDAGETPWIICTLLVLLMGLSLALVPVLLYPLCGPLHSAPSIEHGIGLLMIPIAILEMVFAV